MGDKVALSLLDAVLNHSKLQILNIAQNNLGFKTAQMILTYLKAQSTNIETITERVHIQQINLEFNVMSDAIKLKIGEMLKFMRKIQSGNYEVQPVCDAKKGTKKP